MHEHDAVGPFDCVEAVGDHENSATLHRLLQVVANLALGVVVEGAGGLIHHQQARIAKQTAGDGDALALATREGCSPFAHRRAIAEGQGHDEIVGSGDFGRLHNGIAGGIRVGKRNVVADRA